MDRKLSIQIGGDISAQELNELLATNDWQIDDQEKLQKSLVSCWTYIVARDESGRLVGFVQVISDGIRHAYVCRMIVHPDCRKQGRGSAMMRLLMTVLADNKLHPTLAATPGNEHFYEKFGFRRECKGVVGMCIR